MTEPSPTTDVAPFDAPATPETIVYVVGHNLTGYLPESEPTFVLTAVDALDVLRDDLDRLADHYHEVASDPGADDATIGEHEAACVEAMAEIAAVLARFTDESLRDEAARDALGQGVGHVYVEHSHYWVEPETLGQRWTNEYATRPLPETIGEALDILNAWQ